MSELKAFNCVDSDVQEFCEPRLVYLKSEVDKVIAELEQKNDDLRYSIAVLRKENSHHKYKRGLAMAECCGLDSFHWADDEQEGGWEYKKLRHCIRWKKRWLVLAEKFKESK